MQDAVDTKLTGCSAVDLSTTYKAKLSAVEARLKEVSNMEFTGSVCSFIL